MTVKELIEELEKVKDKDVQVFSVGEYGEYTEISYVHSEGTEDNVVALTEYSFIP